MISPWYSVMPRMDLARVDLPLPDSPTRPRTSPWPRVTLTFFSTWTVRFLEKAPPPWW